MRYYGPLKDTVKSKTCLKRPLKNNTNNGFQDRLSLNAGQKCGMRQGEHSAILSTFIKLPFAILDLCFVFFEWPLNTGFTVCDKYKNIKRLPKCNPFRASLTSSTHVRIQRGDRGSGPLKYSVF